MADRTDDLVIGVSTDMSSVQRALKRLGADVDAASIGIERSFSGAGKKIDRSMSSLQDTINRVTGVAKVSGREWAGALAMPSKALDELAQKYDPVYRAAQQFKGELGELNNALNIGAISADVHAARMDELVVKYDRAEAAARRMKAEFADMAAAERLAATSADGQSMWNTYAGVGDGAGKSARDAAAAMVAELDRLERIASQKAAQIGAAFAADLDARLVPGTRSAARDSAAVFAAEMERLETIAQQKAQQAGANFQAALNASFGIGVRGGRASESAAAFVELDRKARALRAAINPLAAAQDMYNAELAEYAALAHRGAIAADELAAAQAMAKSRLDATTAALGKQGAMGKGANNFNTANIAAQFQDIAVMTQMGIANPLTIALQQGTQLSAVFNQMGGTRDVIRGIGSAFLSIVNPVSLVTVGTIAAGVAAYNYFSEAKDGTATTKEALREQEALIQRVAQAWGDVLPHVRAAAAEQERLAGKAESEETFAKLTADTFKAIGDEVASAGDAITDVMDLLRNTVPPEQIVAIQRALGLVTETAKENKTTVEELDAAHAALMDAFRSENIPVLKDAADALSDLRPRLAEVRDQMESLASEKSVNLMFENLQAAIAGISSTKARGELDDLLKKVREGEVGVDDLIKKLAEISGYAPDVSGIVAAFVAVARAAAEAAEATSSINSQGGPQTRGRYGRFPQLPETAPTPDRRVDPYFQDWRTKTGGGGTKAPKRTAEDRFFEDIEAIKQRTIALAEERAQLGLTFEAQQKRKTAFELEQKALKDAREAARQKGEQDWQNAELTPEQIRQIDEVSDAYAKQAAELKKASEQRAFAEDALYGLFSDLVPVIETGNKALDNFLNKLIEVGLQAALLGKGPFGGGGGGLIGALLRGIGLPGFAQGTLNAPGGWAVVGEKGPELVNLPRGAKVTPNYQLRAPQAPRLSSAAPAASTTYAPVYQIDARGADAAAVARLEAGLKERDRKFGSMVDKRVDTRHFRKTRAA